MARPRTLAFAASGALVRPTFLHGGVCRQRAAHPTARVPAAARWRMVETPEAPAESPQKTVIVDENIAQFCSIDPRTGQRMELTLSEKEDLFLDAVQSYFRGEQALGDTEFDALKEELMWQGSEVTSLSRDEIRFLDAAQAYERGEEGLMGDEEFDRLKVKLQKQGSIVSIQRGPRCSIERKVTFSDCIPDKKRTLALYLPAGILAGLFWLSFAFEVTPLHTVDPVLSLVLGSPIIYFFAKVLTGLVVPDPQILVGDCPHCGKRIHVLFGNVLNVEGFSEEADVKCDKCKAELKINKETNRMILIKEGNPQYASMA